MAKRKSERGDIKDAYMAALAQFGHRHTVTGVDIGPKYEKGRNVGVDAIRVHVAAKLRAETIEPSQLIPPTIEGFPSDVIEKRYTPTVQRARTRQIRAATARVATLTSGVSISHPLCPTGTLSLLVRDNVSGKDALLSNWHVLADSSFAMKGDPILQPGALDGGDRDKDAVGSLTRMLRDVDGDAAIALLNGRRPIDRRITGLGKAITKIASPKRGDIVVKFGTRSTPSIKGKVEGVGRYFPVYRTVERVGIDGFQIVPLVHGNPENIELSTAGDSGAVWLLDGTTTMVGLLFAGESDTAPEKEAAICCFAPRVFKRLRISLVPRK